MRHTPQLITYVDRLGTDLNGLIDLLRGPLEGAFSGVHLLPFFVPIDGADAGFDPTDHRQVDPRLGDWSDIARLAETHEVMADLIVNHISDQSAEFRDWKSHAAASEHDGMFLTFQRVFGSGASSEDLLQVYRPRPGLALTRVRLDDRSQRLVWTTFTEHQIDLDLEHPRGWSYVMSVADALAAGGVSQVRLDAVGYTAKRAGTSCFMIPETYAIIERLAAELRSRDMEVLVEIHGHYRAQIEVASRVDWVYDFALPPLVLDAIYRADPTTLVRWLDIRPTNCVTVLDTHDGIGVIDAGPDPTATAHDERSAGLIDEHRLELLVEQIHRRSGGTSRLATGVAASNLDLYQINCTFYDALGRDDALMVAARLIQCLVPGTPQVYYVGLLAGTNDLELLASTGVGRDVNRHRYSARELDEALARPVVQDLLAVLRWRSHCDVFDGTFSATDDRPGSLHLRWDHPTGQTRSVDAVIDLSNGAFEITLSDGDAERTVTKAREL
jgi:sucrose phosphorylase